MKCLLHQYGLTKTRQHCRARRTRYQAKSDYTTVWVCCVLFDAEGGGISGVKYKKQEERDRGTFKKKKYKAWGEYVMTKDRTLSYQCNKAARFFFLTHLLMIKSRMK